MKMCSSLCYFSVLWFAVENASGKLDHIIRIFILISYHQTLGSYETILGTEIEWFTFIFFDG